MPKLPWPVWLPLAGILFGGSGCTKQARMERHLARGDKQTAAGDYEKAELEYRTALQLVPEDPVVMGRIGILYYNDGRIVPGYLLLQGAVKSRPDDLTLQTAFGLASLTLAKTSDARTAAKKVLDGQPSNEEALLLLVETCVTSRDNDEARRIIEKLRGQNKDVAAFHVALAALEMKQKNLTAAEQELSAALQLDPKSSAVYAQLGSLYQLKKEPKQAAAAIKTGAELSPWRSPRRLKYIDYLMRAGELAEAKKELSQITSKAPDYVPAWTMTMQVAFRQKEYDACLKAAENVLDRDSVNFDALMQRATVRLLKDDIDGAILEFGRIARIYDRAPQAKFQLALAYLRKGDTARADEQLNLAVRLSPTFDEAIVALAELNVQKGNPGAAVSPLTQLLKRQPKAGPAAILLAKAYQALGRLEDALATLRQSAAAAPQSPEPPYLVGSILFQQNRIGEARTCFEESVRLAEDYWPAQEKLVDVDLLEKRSAAAMERTERMLQKYPKAAAPRLFRAKIRLSSGDTDGAEADLLTAIDLEPKSAYAYFQLSKVYFVANRTREAIEKMATLAAKTNSPGALMQLGMLQRAVAKFEESRGTYEKLLSADPKFFPALNNLAILHSENLGQLEKGFSLAKQARTIAPTDPVVADTLGWIYFRMGQYESALPLLLEASTKTIPPDPDVEYHLGMAHYFLAQEESAKKAFGRVVDQASNSPAKEDAVRRLAVLAIDAATADSSVRADLEQRAQKDGKDPVLLCRLAGMERRAGASAQAAEHYEAALKLSPRSPLIMEALVEIYLGPVPQPQRARELAKAAHEMAPNDAQISRYLGHLLYKAGEFAWSATLLGEAAGQLSTSSEVFHDLAFAYYNLGRLRDAEATVKKFLALDSPMAARQSCERLGKMIAASSSPGNAMAAKAEAVEILRTEPEYLPALAVSALALEQQGDYQSAAKAYEKILSKNPVFALAMRQLAILYAEHLGDDQKAEDMALAARKTYPDDVQLAHHFGVVEYRRGDYTAAARLLQQSTVARDANPEGVFLLGMSYYHLKNVMESRRALQRALELNLPEQEANEARRVIEALNQIERE